MRRRRFISAGLVAAAALAIAPASAAAAPSPLVDSDFSGGTAHANTWVVEPGELRLSPMTLGTSFDGTALPTGWTQAPWTPPAGTATVAGGALTVDGARVHEETPAPTHNAGQVLEFRARFSVPAAGGAEVSETFQHVGFGDTFNNPPWAMFSTGGGALPFGLYARTQVNPAPPANNLIADVNLREPHLYRIEWTATEVKYYVDDQLKVTHALAVAGPMRPVVSDFAAAGGAVSVDWIGMSPFPATRSGTFTSRLLEADDTRAVWGWLVATASGNVTFETRTGNSAVTMSDFQPLGAGGAIHSPPGKLIQYRATLTGGESRLDGVSIDYTVDTTAPTATLADVAVSGTTARVTFSSADGDVARFECSLDGGAFTACTSPRDFTGLAAGAHTIAVRAVDRAGNVGIAVSRAFTIVRGSGGQTPPPTGTDTKAPTVVLGSRTARASRRGVVRIRLGCPADEVSCRVGLRLKYGRKTAGRAKITLDGGETRKVKVKLSRKARVRLAARGRLRVVAIVKVRDAAGNRKRALFAMTLKAH